MSMLEYNEITVRKFIIDGGEPWEVIDSHVFRKQQRKPVNHVKLRSLLTGRVTEKAFGASEKAEEADITTQEIKYLYNNKGQWWFSEIADPSKRFQLDAVMMGDQGRFLKANSIVEAKIFDEKIFGLKLPIKVELKVTDAPPAVKGDTAKGGSKQITLETGAIINAPMFVNEGDTVRINTETGEYAERV